MYKKEGISLEGCITSGQGDRSYLDHQKINAQFFKKFGIPNDNIQFSSLDTKTNPQCYSYRRDGKDCGEHFSCIWMDEKK